MDKNYVVGIAETLASIEKDYYSYITRLHNILLILDTYTRRVNIKKLAISFMELQIPSVILSNVLSLNIDNNTVVDLSGYINCLNYIGPIYNKYYNIFIIIINIDRTDEKYEDKVLDILDKV